MFILRDKLPLILAILLYILIYFLRWQQGGWEVNLDLFPNIRQVLDAQISHFLPTPQAQLLSGIVLGEKKDLPYDLRLALRDTSTLHIVVVSGQNLSLVAGFFLTLSGLIRRKNTIILSFLVIVLYVILTGAQVPVLRAAVMVTFAFWAQIVGRQRDSIWILIITGCIMLLINPKWISDLSFQLSFMATVGVVCLSPILLQFFKNLPLLGADLATTTGAQLMVMPIIVQNFHQFSVVGIFANLLVLWTVPFIMILGTIFLVATYISSFIAQLISFPVLILLTYFIYTVKFFASLPFAWEYVGEQVVLVWVGYYLLLFGIFRFMILLKDAQGKNSSRSKEGS